MFKIKDEPDSPSKRGVFKICDELESPNERACLGGGGGWGCANPQPPPLVEAVQGCLKASGLKYWLKPIMRALCLQMGGGCAPPQPPRCFKPCKLASKHVSVFGSYHASILFAKGGWAAPPFFSSASLLQST